MTAADVNIGIGALLETFEMMFVFYVNVVIHHSKAQLQDLRIASSLGIHLQTISTFPIL
jgi:hypothetical protein